MANKNIQVPTPAPEEPAQLAAGGIEVPIVPPEPPPPEQTEPSSTTLPLEVQGGQVPASTPADAEQLASGGIEIPVPPPPQSVVIEPVDEISETTPPFVDIGLVESVSVSETAEPREEALQQITRVSDESRDVIAEFTPHPTKEFNGIVYAVPGGGDQYITEEDYQRLDSRQREVYNSEGYDALIEYTTAEAERQAAVRGIAIPSLQPRMNMTPEVMNAWKEYVAPEMVGYGEGQLHPYQVAEALIDASAPDAVIYAYIMQDFQAQRGAKVGRFITYMNEKFDTILSEDDESQFNSLVEMGFIPDGSRFVPAVTEEDIRQIQATSVERGLMTEEEMGQIQSLEPSEWGYVTPEQIAETRTAAQERYEQVIKPFMASVRAERRLASSESNPLVFLKDNPDEEQVLLDYGYSPEQVRVISELSGYLSDDNRMDWMGLYEDGNERLLSAYGYTPEQVSEISRYVDARKSLGDYIDPETGNMSTWDAIYDGVTADTIRTANYEMTDDEYDRIKGELEGYVRVGQHQPHWIEQRHHFASQTLAN